MCLPARVVARSSTPRTASTDTISLCVASLTTGRFFGTSPYGAGTTIKEERKRIVLASFRKRADIL